MFNIGEKISDMALSRSEEFFQFLFKDNEEGFRSFKDLAIDDFGLMKLQFEILKLTPFQILKMYIKMVLYSI